MKRLAQILCLSLATLFAHAAFAQAGPRLINISGGLFQPGGGAVLSANVTFKIEIRDKAGTCVLYSEVHSGQDLSQTKGAFSLLLGAGSSPQNFLSGSAALDAAVFKNPGVIPPFTGCASGVTFAAGDERVIRVYYDTGSGLTAMTPDVPVVASAYAMVAETLQGKGADEFAQLQGTSAGNLNQANLEYSYSLTNWQRLKDLIDGVSSQYLPTAGTGTFDFGARRITGVTAPGTSSYDVINKGYADAYIGGKGTDLTSVGAGFGGGQTLVWDQAQNKWVTGTVADASKLPLAGGTMSGDITMAGNDLFAVGDIIMNVQKKLQLGRFTDAEEATLIATLGTAHAGMTWYNSSDQAVKVWNGTAVVRELTVSDSGTSVGTLDPSMIPASGVTAGTYGSPTSVPVFTVGADGRLTVAYGTAISGVAPGGSAGGDLTGTYPNPQIAAAAVTTAKLGDNAITAAKIKSTGVAVNRLIATDPVTPNNLTYFECSTVNQIIAWTASGWACTTVSSLAPVKTVAGRTPDVAGNVALAAYDINGIESAATKDFGTAAGELVELDGAGKIPSSLLPGGLGTITSVVATAPLQGGGTSGAVTVSIDVGTGANQVVRLNASAQIPAVDGSLVTNVNATKLATRNVSSAAPGGSQVLGWNSSLSQWEPMSTAVGSVTTVVSGTGLVAGTITSEGTINVDVGTGANKVVQYNGSAQYPGNDGSLITNVNATKLATRTVSAAAPTSAQVLAWNSSLSQWEPSTASTGSVTSVVSGTGLIAGTITSSGTINIDVGTGANKILQLNGSAQIPAVDGSLVTNVNATRLATRNVSSAAPTTNQVLTWNGSQWEAAAVSNAMAWPLLAAPGVTTAGAPSYSFSGDSDTGLYSAGPGTASLATNGTARLTVNNSGATVTGNASAANFYGTNMGVETGYENNAVIRYWTGYMEFTRDFSSDTGFGAKLGRSAGSAAAPTFTFRDTEDTGMYAPGSAALRLTTAGVDRIAILPNGQVGIGTTSPGSAALNIDGTTSSNSALVIPRATTAARPGVAVNGMIRYNTNTNKFEFFENNAWVNYGTGSGSSTLAFPLLASPATTPASAVSYAFSGDGNTGMHTLAADTLALTTAGTARFVALPNGNVGIGTTNPSHTLSFEGSGARKVAMEANSSSAAGNNLTIQAGASGSGANLDGGNLILQSGESTGQGGSSIILNVPWGAQGAGSSVRQATNNVAYFDGAKRNVSLGGGIANSLYGIALGSNTTVNGFSSVALERAVVNGDYSVGMGQLMQVDGNNSVGISLSSAGTTVSQNNTMAIMGGRVGIGTVAPFVGLEIATTGTGGSAILIPRDTTATRPTGVNGMIRYNTNTNKFEFFENNVWVNYGTGASGGGSSVSFPLLASPIGTASAPAYAFTGDADTGMYLAGADTIGFTAGGAKRVSISNSALVADFGTAASGAGAHISLTAQSGGSNSSGGDINLTTGAGGGSWNSGNVNINLGNGSNGGTPGWVGITRDLTQAYTATGADIAPIANVEISNAWAVDNNTAVMRYFVRNAANRSQVAYHGVFSQPGSGIYTPNFVWGVSTGTATTWAERMRLDYQGNLSIGTTSAGDAILNLAATGTNNSAIVVPRSTTATRPNTAVNGMIRYNTNTNKFEFFENNLWVNYGTGASGGGGGISFPLLASPATTPAANVSYSFSGDPNTGMHTLAADTLALTTAGTTRLAINPNGFIGIGSNLTAPVMDLDITKSYAGSVGLKIRNNDTGSSSDAGIYLSVNNTETGWLGVNSSANAVEAFRTRMAFVGDKGVSLIGDYGSDIRLYAGGAGNMYERMRINADGTAGVGTATPRSGLDIATTGTNSALIVPRDTTANRPVTNVANGMIRYNTNTNKFEFFENNLWVNYGTGASGGGGSLSFPLLASPATTPASAVSYSFSGDPNTGMHALAADTLALTTAGTARLTILPNGNVGVGGAADTSTPFQISTDGINYPFVVKTAGNSITPGLRTKHSNGTLNSRTGTTSGQNIGEFEAYGYGSTSENWVPSAAITMAATEDHTNTAHGGQIKFRTTANGTTVHSDRMVIGEGGNVGIAMDDSTNARLAIAGTGPLDSAILIPRATTANRPYTAINGMIRYNTNTNKFEFFENNNWVNYGTGSSGGGGSISFPILASPATTPVSAVTYSFTGDGNTGMHTLAADTLSLTTAGTSRLSIAPAGYVGINTAASNAAMPLQLGNGSTTEGSLLAYGYGTAGVGQSLPVSGAGRRMMWYAKKGAFRSGAVGEGGYSSDKWDDTNIGNFSTALGVNATASGYASFAVGEGVSAEADNAVAIGKWNAAVGYNSIVLGDHVSTYGDQAFAQGQWTIAAGANSIAMGTDTRTGTSYGGSGGDYSMALGLGDATGTVPQVVGTGSFGIFMGDQSGVSLNQGQTMAIMGGRVGIGTVTPSVILDVNGLTTQSAIRIPRDTTANRPTAATGLIRYNTSLSKLEVYEGSAWVQFTVSSDARLKTDVETVRDGLQKVEQMRPVYFNWDQTKEESAGYGTKHQVGFIAQEMEKVLPEVVNGQGEEIRTLEYGKVVAIAIAAIQDLFKSIKASDQRVADQELRLQRLEKENEELKKQVHELLNKSR